jgi:hypothetical protein
MESVGCDAYRQEGFKAIAGLARSRTMRTPVNAYSKDYEYRADTSEARLYVAMLHIMVRRIAVKSTF